jgi:hypothetical protein
MPTVELLMEVKRLTKLSATQAPVFVVLVLTMPTVPVLLETIVKLMVAA